MKCCIFSVNFTYSPLPIFLSNNTLLFYSHNTFSNKINAMLYDLNLNTINNHTIPFTSSKVIVITNSLTNTFIGSLDTLYQYDINGDFSSPQSKVNTEYAAFHGINTLIASTSTVGFIANATAITVFNYNPNPPKPTTAATTASTGSTSGSTTSTTGPLGADFMKLMDYNGRKSYNKRKNNIHNNVRRKKDKHGLRVKKINLNPKLIRN